MFKKSFEVLTFLYVTQNTTFFLQKDTTDTYYLQAVFTKHSQGYSQLPIFRLHVWESSGKS